MGKEDVEDREKTTDILENLKRNLRKILERELKEDDFDLILELG